MAKEKSVSTGAVMSELVHLGVYKRNQGRIVRQVTFAALAVTIGLGAWQLFERGRSAWDWHPGVYFGVPAALLLAGLWISYRVVNIPAFADFLVAVEAEMNKVSWPSRTELVRSSIVVILLLFMLAVILFAFDTFWFWGFRILGILPW